VAKTWTIEVGGVARNYRRIKFQRKLETNKPAIFEATIKFDAGVAYWDLVEIKRDGTPEFKGFVEIIDIRWDEVGRYLYISGRDTKVILWKKYSDNFSNMHEDTKGFFGRVKAQDLITFLLRTPKSDFDPDAYPNNKEGWGMDVSRLHDFTAVRTSVGDPNYTKLRRRGYGWRNSGNPFASEVDVVDAEISRSNWTANGAAPYLDDEDSVNFIESNTADGTAIYSFEDLPATATSVERVHMTVVWRPDQTWWFWINSECDVYISDDAGTTWYYVGAFGGRESPIKPNPWRHFTFDISSRINTVAKVDDCRVKFVNKSTSLTTNITQAYLSVGYTASGTQEVYDRFDIPFETETIAGIYVESRMDDESYPRDYEIVTVANTKDDLSGYTEEDNNNHITVVGTDHIDFDAYQDEDAWLRYDYGAAYFGTYFKHTVKVKAVTDPVPQAPNAGQPEVTGIVAGFWCVSDGLNDLIGLEGGSVNHLSLSIYRKADINGGVPCFRLHEQDGGSGQSTYSAELTEGTTYSVEIERIGSSLVAIIYSGSTVLSTLSLTLGGATNTFRYMLACATANRGAAVNCDIDIDDLIIEKETTLVTVASNTYRDIIHSWTPQSMNHIRIKITSQDTSHSWAISQVYVYKAESCDYRVYKETGCTPTYAADQYISALSFDSSYTTAIGPLNLPRARLIDVINTIVKQCHATYIPYEWWLALDSNNTFHFKNQKDDAPAVTFSKGTNLGGVKRRKDVSDTVQRVRIIGRGEGKRQEDVSSDWVEDATAMGNVNSFYEDIVSKKSMVDKTMSELVANIHLNEEAEPKDQPIVAVNNDSYASMAYDVGDTITVVDSLTGTSGSHRIYNISKEIDDNGEEIVITVDVPERDDADEWVELYKRLKELEIGGVTAADWTGEADEETKVTTDVITDFFEKTAKNDEDAAKRDIKDPSWYMSPNPTGYTAPQDAFNAGPQARGTPASYGYANGRTWTHQNEWMKLDGPNAGNAIQTLLVELRGDSGEEIDVYMRQNPKLVFELKVYEDTGTPIQWYSGDYFDVGLYNAATDKGYFFRIKASGGAIFKIYACWNETGNAADTQEQLIRSITRNVKYRLEIITEDDNRLVIFNVYDMDQTQKYPPSAVKTNMDRNMLIRPLYMFLSAFDDNANPNVRATVYVYKFRTEWEKVQ